MTDKISLTCDCGKLIWINIKQLKEDVKEELLKGDLRPLAIDELLQGLLKQGPIDKVKEKRGRRKTTDLEKNLIDDETKEALLKLPEGATIKQFMQETGISMPTARIRLNRLIDLGLATQNKKSKEIVYKAITEDKNNIITDDNKTITEVKNND